MIQKRRRKPVKLHVRGKVYSRVKHELSLDKDKLNIVEVDTLVQPTEGFTRFIRQVNRKCRKLKADVVYIPKEYLSHMYKTVPNTQLLSRLTNTLFQNIDRANTTYPNERKIHLSEELEKELMNQVDNIQKAISEGVQSIDEELYTSDLFEYSFDQLVDLIRKEAKDKKEREEKQMALLTLYAALLSENFKK